MKVVLRLTEAEENEIPESLLQGDIGPEDKPLPATLSQGNTLFKIIDRTGQHFYFYGDQSQFQYDSQNDYFNYKNYVFLVHDDTIEGYILRDDNSVHSVQLHLVDKTTDKKYDLTKLPYRIYDLTNIPQELDEDKNAAYNVRQPLLLLGTQVKQLALASRFDSA